MQSKNSDMIIGEKKSLSNNIKHFGFVLAKQGSESHVEKVISFEDLLAKTPLA